MEAGATKKRIGTEHKAIISASATALLLGIGEIHGRDHSVNFALPTNVRCGNG